MGTKRKKQTLAAGGGGGTRTDGPGAPRTPRTPELPDATARAAAKLLPNNKERRRERRSTSRDGAPHREWSWGPGTHGRARGAGARGGRPTRASPGPREPALGPGPGDDPRVYLGSALPSRHFPGPAGGVRAQAAPLPRRARRGPRGPGRWSSGAAPPRGASLAGRRLPSRVPAPRGTAAEPSATQEGPPEDGRTDGRKAGVLAGARTGSAT